VQSYAYIAMLSNVVKPYDGFDAVRGGGRALREWC